ncbi:hypothetical protein N7540_004259 [Penicillium herquei]|nr:hypothetical protein N7540_004259 [Penicillium herquei]
MTDHEQIIPPSILLDGTENPSCPYVVGNIIKLQLKTLFDGQRMDAKIIKVFEPFTCSCVMVVRPVSDCPTTDWEGDMVLKLFDRRFATERRKKDEISPWTLDIEQNYHQFILNGDAAKLITKLTADKDTLGRDSHTWNSSQEETCLHDYMQVYQRQSICEEAIRIINLIGDRGILNEDVKTRNFVVQSCPENQFRVFMIDFALCNLREEYPDEIDWEKCKAIQDEEGAVGYVMQKKLQGGFVYHRSAPGPYIESWMKNTIWMAELSMIFTLVQIVSSSTWIDWRIKY